MSNNYKWLVFINLAMLVGCVGRIHQASSRVPPGFRKIGNDNYFLKSQTPSSVRKKRPDLFVREKSVVIEPVHGASESGSLFQVGDERNYLFMSTPPITVGDYITVEVDSNRVLQASESASGVQTQKPTTNDGLTKEDQEILNALPSLKPAPDQTTLLLKKFQMKVTHILQNGDALLLLQRRSVTQNNGSQILVKARLPYSKLIAADAVKTSDLSEVQFSSVEMDEEFERSSSGWEDEYTVRLSGFDEAKSSVAFELEEKRKHLMSIREKLQQRIESLAKERSELAKQREDLMKEKQNRLDEVKQLRETIEKQKEELGSREAEQKQVDRSNSNG